MNISAFQQCANCGACYNICSRNAISVKEDGLFYVPTVDKQLCIDCSRCVQVCPVNQIFEGIAPIYACAGWHKDNRIVLNSSSGGVFYGIAQSVISEGGLVFSAIYSEDYKTVMIASSDDVPLERMLKSKYVESIIGLSFQRIKDELATGRSVLFCGTPCQTAGLHIFLGKQYDRLITCDFACGGVPSHKIYQKYLSELESKYHSTVQSVDFRPKTHGWKRYTIKIKFENGKEYIRLGTEDPYLKSFLFGKYTVRDYCLTCKFSEQHTSDITIADFWLHEKLSTLKHDEGISLVLCNSVKGKHIIDAIEDQYDFVELDAEKVSYNNHLQISEQKIINHNAFIKEIKESNFDTAYRKYFPESRKSKLKNWIIRMIFRKKG